MASTKRFISRFRSEIQHLIAEIEAHIQVDPSASDREYQFQTQAFEERCGQAEQFTSRLDSVSAGEKERQWSCRDGDAHRIHESLKLSLNYFRRNPDQ